MQCDAYDDHGYKVGVLQISRIIASHGYPPSTACPLSEYQVDSTCIPEYHDPARLRQNVLTHIPPSPSGSLLKAISRGEVGGATAQHS
eukprot:1453870-Pyramimonas_sp.AAC.1